ncbi:MAG: CTP synthase [Kiritimatiellia bacterium]
MTKHMFVTGGVVSSLGKGLTAASIALLLKQRGYRICLQKMDPYLNVDPGTMSPYQHGEVYVTADGAETDLDLGHYERFTGIECTSKSNYTTGSIYSSVISAERKGEYLGQTVQVIPHVTDEIKKAVASLDGPETDIAITEIGGTVGDIESLPFLEAIREYRQETGSENALFMHITLVPYIKAARELKTKPSQQSVGILRNIGIIPDILICRCEHSLEESHRSKLALFCNVERELIIEEKDVSHSIYEVPIELARQDLDVYVLEKMGLHVNRLDLDAWKNMLKVLVSPEKKGVDIAVVGKYMELQDSYKSIYEALTHGGIANHCRVNIRRVESESIESDGAQKVLRNASGILIPGGFGYRGTEGKIQAVRYARENGIPFFGICLGMQCAVMEFARNVCGMKDANSTEFNEGTEYPVIGLMKEQQDVSEKGGTMRLGAYPCHLENRSLAGRIYGADRVSERHRHRYEFNNRYRQTMKNMGMRFSGIYREKDLVEIVEIENHPWFLACQFHPEFRSTPLAPHPLFGAFVKAALERANGNDKEEE